MPLRHVLLTVRVTDEQGKYLGGDVALEIVRRGRRVVSRARANASRPIVVRGGRGRRWRTYRVTVSPLSGLPPQTQFVRVPPGGTGSLVFLYPMRVMRALRAEDGMYEVSGRVLSPASGSTAGLQVQIVDHNVGGVVVLAEAVTDVRGHYQVSFAVQMVERRKPRPDLQARVISRKGVAAVSEIRYNAEPEQVLNILIDAADSASLATEHEALLQAIGESFSGPVSGLKETTEQRDITYLANKSGWDARAVALAALADQFSQIRGRGRAESGIGSPFYYALFRAGLPANAAVYQIDPGTVQRVWREALGAGVIPQSLEQELPAATAAFTSLSADAILKAAPPAGASTLTEMLASAQLDEESQRQLAMLYVENRTNLPAFWKNVAATFGADTADRLQLTGKIGLLTLNNAPLMQRLQRRHRSLTGLADLAAAGLHSASKWETLVSGVAVPNAISGNTAEERERQYAGYLATQIRLSYPTGSVAQMVQAGEFQVDRPAGAETFLTQHQGQFEIGAQPVEQFIARRGLQVPTDTVEDVKRLQRLYQATSSDRGMSTLLSRGVRSAYDVVRYGRDAFVRDFTEALGASEAEQTYRRSTQIHNTVLNVALSFLSARNGIALGGTPTVDGDRSRLARSGGIVESQPANPGADVIAYPTLEGLFGSLDFCACEHCRSILSPAAYLVDLLNFIDQPAPPDGGENPQAVLFQRRPDLQHLPLTCENTNTAMPYIDVVNETLEHFISNTSQQFSLAGYVGHDTGSVESADLLASPQFVADEAYDTLLRQRFPLNLPFHAPLEELRRYFTKFEVPLTLAMERLRVNDAIERGGNPYGWRDILLEEIGISRAEYNIFADSSAVPLWRMYGFPNATSDGDVIAELSNAKRFARRLEITYEELAQILKTRFVNPNGDVIPKAEKLGVSFGVLAALERGDLTPGNFLAMLPAGSGAPDPDAYGGDIIAWVTDASNFARLMNLIVLNDPSDKPDLCRFDALELRHARPPANPADTSTRLAAPEFVRILRFIRLWRRTGWTIDQTDLAASAMFNADFSPTLNVDSLESLDAGFVTLLPRLGMLIRIMRALNLTVARDLSSLLVLWAPISTYGPAALYRQMFLNPALLKQDAAFADNGLGEFLQDPSQRLLAHREGVRAAMNLTGEEFDLIVGSLGFDADTELSVGAVSAVFRRGWLARRLSLSVKELLLLMKLTRLRPFGAPDPAHPDVLRLAKLVKDLKDRNLKSSAVLYLLWNEDLSGTASLDPEDVRELARTLRADFAAIDEQFAALEDPAGDVLGARLSLIYGTDATAQFLSFLMLPGESNALEVDVAYTNPQPALRPAITATDPNLKYDHFRHRLSASGIFTGQRWQQLAALANVPTGFRTAIDELFNRSADVVGSFFGRYPELRPLFKEYRTSPDPPAEKRERMLAALQPQLAQIRKRQQARQRLSTAVNVVPEFTEAIVDARTAPYPLHAAGDPARPALDDIVALDRRGLTARFFFRNTATGAVDVTVPVAGNLDYASGRRNPLPENPGGGRISGIWSGLIEAPESGFFNVVVETDPGATVALTIDAVQYALTQHGRVWRNTDPIELAAGVMYDIDITVERLRDVLRVKWESPTRTREVVPARYLYPTRSLRLFDGAYTRFIKAASLAAGLSMSAAEMTHFATHSDYEIAGDGWLNLLTVKGPADQPAAAALLRPLEALLAYARIKGELSQDDDTLIEILKDPVASADGPLLILTQWDRPSLDAVVAHFNRGLAGLASFALFERVYDAFTLIRLMGIGGVAMIEATTNNPDADTVRSLQSALRARYEAADWRTVVQPVNDALRGRKRDALVSYILHHMRSRPGQAHIDTPEKLFEYFLMDVQMEPCMQTSRIRHALSSVQLFIERCLMNLEPRVLPETLNGQQWVWMKRYRVWEANRKVFLYPENWLEPELRDDKSSFFKEVESELLQGDITDDAAMTAILNYLGKLESVAKLQPVGIYHIDADPAQRTPEVDHVVAVTPGSRRKYFYRSRHSGSWTPWEPVTLDIEDTPVIPVVWEGRLLLFWLQVMKETPATSSKPTGNKKLVELSTLDIPGDPVVTTKAILGWSEYYNGKWQPPKTSEVDLPSEIHSSGAAFARQKLTLGVAYEHDDDWLKVNIIYQGSVRTSYLLYNTHASPVRQEDQTDPEIVLGFNPFQAHRIIDPADAEAQQSLDVSYMTFDFTPGGGFSFHWPFSTVNRHVLEPETRISVITPHHPPGSRPFEAPFFVDDRRHTFFVSTAQESKWVGNFMDLGITYNPSMKVDIVIPPIVVQPEYIATKPSLWGGEGPIGPLGPEPGVVYSTGITEFVTQDAYIQQGLATSGVVTYGDMPIGPSGGFTAPQAMAFRRRQKAGQPR